LWPVRDTVDHKAARPTNTFAAVMVENDRLLSAGAQLLVQNIKHFQERHIGTHIPCIVSHEATLGLRVFLPPDM
jgi:hypothetical protein